MTIRIPSLFTTALLLVPALALAVQSEAPPAPAKDTPATGAATNDLAFAASLEACVAASHRSPHPFVSGFVIEHQISGLEDGRCNYSQSMPGNMRMECKFSDAGRNAMALEFREMAAGRMSGGTGEQPAWTQDCEIITADGKRMPMAQG
ncbi:MAG TPA: hypothetical protein VFY00_06325 [Arenimonas sp.]|nr:hypothetical protein [Arenimonas sp.]